MKLKFLRKNKLSKFHFLDWIVIVILLVIIGTFLYLRIRKQDKKVQVTLVVSQGEWWWSSNDPPYWYVDDLQIGDAAYNALGQKKAEVTDIRSFTVGGPFKKALIDLALMVTFDKNQNTYSYDNQPLEVGGSLNLSINGKNLRGAVTNIASQEADDTLLEKRIRLKLEGVPPKIAESYQEGLVMSDSLGRELATIERVEKKPALWEVFSDIRGRIVEVYSQKDYDLIIDMRLKTFKSQGLHYFVDGSGIKVNSNIWFFFPETVIEGAKIIEILE